MMETAVKVFGQVLTLFIMMGAGYAITKFKMLDKDGNRQITDLLLQVVTPCVIIHAFVSNFSRSMLGGLLLSFLLAVLSHAVSIALSLLLFRNQGSRDKGVLRFAVIYSNCGFMGLPLISAVIGEEGLIYGAVYVAVFNILSWTHGIGSMSGGKSMNLKKILFNPGTIGIAIALPLVLLNIQIPAPVNQAVAFFSGLNTPLAMIVIGFYIANTGVLGALKDKHIYFTSFIRLLVIPVIIIFILYFIPCDILMKKSFVLSASAPVAAACTLMAAKCGSNTELSSHCVAVTTLFSAITMPLIYTAASYIF